MTVEVSLEQRVRYLEDIAAIRKVKWAYCHFADRGWQGSGDDPEAYADLFTEHCVCDKTAAWEDDHEGSWTGRQAVLERERGTKDAGKGRWAIHIASNGNIDVNGDTAVGEWHAIVPLISDDGEALWVCGIYHDEFERTDGGWKISALRFLPAFITPFDGPGWAKVPLVPARRW
jgi:hypothetical protein